MAEILELVKVRSDVLLNYYLYFLLWAQRTKRACRSRSACALGRNATPEFWIPIGMDSNLRLCGRGEQGACRSPKTVLTPGEKKHVHYIVGVGVSNFRREVWAMISWYEVPSYLRLPYKFNAILLCNDLFKLTNICPTFPVSRRYRHRLQSQMFIWRRFRIAT